ncbi:alpha/beta hydrolase [Chryseomicrobium palamuruense]|uniref:Alpha/beta hydrolase n=1 Tax=Chryseomicrobium palamuruense TaxID=682973 RepID=A0ABV8USI9_9BACL
MNAPLHYEIRQPSSMDSSKTYPALFVLHGMGSNEHDLLPLVEKLADQFIIFNLRGPISQPPGYAFFTIEGFGKPHRTVFEDAMSKLTEFLDYAVANYPVDKDYVYFMGFSQGAISSMSLSTRIPARIRGVLALSGYVPDFIQKEDILPSANHVRYFISHGQQDPVLPYQWGEAARDFFTSRKADVTFQSYPDAHFVSMPVYEDFTAWLLKDVASKTN